ncbi:MAG: ParA family protein [Synergistaceae bacterium]|jgi:hypothetical protein|nr:ParA family protein [Synergistaceae bacterium]
MAKIISLFNHKGGVSKTTTTFSLGWSLAAKKYKVLMVDADPQSNLTSLSLSLQITLALELGRSPQFAPMANIPGFMGHALRSMADYHGVDYILIDMAPSLSVPILCSPRFIGIIQQNYRPRRVRESDSRNRPSRAFQVWIKRVHSAVTESLVPALLERGLAITEARFRDVDQNLYDISDDTADKVIGLTA